MNAEPLPSALGLARTAMRRSRAAGLGRVLRCAALALPATLIRILFWPRDPGITGLSDSQLADIGLTRADVEGAGRDPASRARVEMLRHHGRWHV